MRLSNKTENKLDINNIRSDVDPNINSEIHQEWLFEDALSHIGIGKMHYLLTFISGLIISASMTETMGMNFIMKSAECDLKLTSADKGFMSSIGYVGIVCMAFIWGYLSDTKGRRDVMKWTLLLSSGASILSSFAPDLITFNILRFLVGIFLSASVGSTYPYLGEFTPVKYRQTIMAVASLFFGLSQIYVAMVAWLVLSLEFKFSIFGLLDYRPWRLLVVLDALPGLVAAVALCFYPESPKYHMAQGEETKALDGLIWIYSKNTGKAIKNFPIKKLRFEKIETSTKHKNLLQSFMSQALPIMKPPYVKHLLVSFLISFFLFFTCASLGLWYMEIQNDVIHSTNTGTLCEILVDYNSNHSVIYNEEKGCNDFISSDTYIYGFVLGSLYTLTFVLIAGAMQFMGRGWISCVFLFTSGFSGLSLYWVTHPILTLILFTAFLSLGGPIVSVVTGSAVLLFPTNHRAMALCIVLTLGRLGAIVGTNFIGSFLHSNCEMTMGVLSGVIIGAGLLNFLLPLR